MPTTASPSHPWPGRGVAERLHDPLLVVDLVQTAKTAVAGGLAWWVGTNVLHLEQAFLAPWAAVLVVHSTVYRTLSRGSQQVAATFAAVLLAFALGSVLGTSALSLGLLILIGFLLGRLRWLRDEATTIATTGLVTLATGSIAQPDLLVSRLGDTAVGVLVGLSVNFLVWPPLRDRAAWSHAERLPHDLAGVVRDIADAVGPDLEPRQADAWVRDVRRVDVGIDRSWQLVWQARESGRFNPRRSAPTGIEDLIALLHLLEQAVADTLSMARTVRLSAEHRTPWEDRFREEWRGLARRTAAAVDVRDGQDLEAIRADLDAVGPGPRHGAGAAPGRGGVGGVRRPDGQPAQRPRLPDRGGRLVQPLRPRRAPDPPLRRGPSPASRRPSLGDGRGPGRRRRRRGRRPSRGAGRQRWAWLRWP